MQMFQESEVERTHSTITYLNDEMAKLTKVIEKQAEVINTLEAENKKISKQRKRMLSHGVLEEQEKIALKDKRIQVALDQQLKETQHDLGQLEVSIEET